MVSKSASYEQIKLYEVFHMFSLILSFSFLIVHMTQIDNPI